MFKAPDSDYLVPFDGSFKVADAPTKPGSDDRKKNRDRLREANRKMDKLQRVLMAGDRRSILLIFQDPRPNPTSGALLPANGSRQGVEGEIRPLWFAGRPAGEACGSGRQDFEALAGELQRSGAWRPVR